MGRLSREKKELGDVGEAIANEWLKANDYRILEASKIHTGGAPLLTGKDSNIILPNSLTWKEKQMGWVEVKTKSTATRHENPPRRWEHGIPLRHWNDYLKIREVTGVPVSLAVVEINTVCLLLAQLETLQGNSRRYMGYKMGNEPHIFFDVSDFIEYPLDDLAKRIGWPKPIPPKAPRTLTQGNRMTAKQNKLL